MNNKRFLGLVVIVLGLTSAVFLLSKKDKEQSIGVDLSDRDFNIENKDDIGRISLKSKNYTELVFTREGESWMINGKIPANELVIKNFLGTLTNLQMVYLPPRESMPVIVEDTKKNGIRLKIYDRQDNLLKDYYVGAHTADDRGTFYLMANSNTPYVMQIKGFDGSIRNRMLYNLDGWRSKSIFNENPDSIQFVEIEYLHDQQNSFAIRREKNGFVLDKIGEITKFKPTPINLSIAEAYLNQFKKLDAEANDNENPNIELIKSYEEFALIRVGFFNGNVKTIKLTSKEELEFGKTTRKYSDLEVDDRLFIKNKNDELKIIKFSGISKILVPYSFFQENVQG